MNVLTKQRVVLEPEAQAFADATAKPPFLFDLGPEKGRAPVNEVQSAPVEKLPVDIEDLVIEGGPGGQVSMRIIRPQNAPATLPVIQYNHGAG
jgi:acetyl esterase/lipase